MFDKLSTIKGVVTRAGLDDASARAIDASAGIALPDDHHAFLKFTNGAEGFGGYVRLFGFGPNCGVDLLEWNAESFWKFAWVDHLTPYFCFGETGWGDQFAYRVDKLKIGDPSVYFLDCLAMRPQRIADDFGEFFAREFLRSCYLPYDEMTLNTRRTLGDLRPSEHVVYNPSPMIGGTENIENVVKIPSRSAMITAGDLAVGVGELDAGVLNFRLEPYDDTEGRARLRILPL